MRSNNDSDEKQMVAVHRIGRRAMLDERTKERMMAILLQNEKAFKLIRDELTLDRFGYADTGFKLAWKLCCDFFDQYGRLPEHNELTAAVSFAYQADSGVLQDPEVEALDHFIDWAYDKSQYERPVGDDDIYTDWAVKAVKKFLEERLDAEVKQLVQSTGTIPVDMPMSLGALQIRAERIAGLTATTVGMAFPEGWDEEIGIELFSTGIPYYDEFLGGGQAAGEVYGLLGSFGSCKCLGRGTLVLMYDGTVKPVEQVRKGDLLMGPDSKPRRVRSLAKGVDQLYRVTPTKGDPYVVNEGHILSLKLSPCKRGDIAKVVNISVRDYLKKPSYFKNQHKGWRTGVDFAVAKDAERDSYYQGQLDPYFLGVWLGDGHTGETRVTTGDTEIVAFLGEFAARYDLSLTFVADTGKAATWAISGSGGVGSNPVRTALQRLGVFNNKHVPQSYLSGSRETRLQILAGLLDADGCLGTNCYQFVNSTERLVDAVVFLSRSLGLAAYKTSRIATCMNNGVSGESFYATISGHTNIVPCKLPRRRATTRKQKKDVCMVGIKVEPIGLGDFFGFEIDGDHLFMLGDFTVTHNTTSAVQLVVEAARGFDKVATAAKVEEEDTRPVLSFIVSYEERIKNTRQRAMGYAGRIQRSSLESLGGKSGRRLTDLSHSDSLKDYERELFATELASGLHVPGEYERALDAMEWMNSHCVFLDMTGHEQKGLGNGGIKEVSRLIAQECRRRNARCGFVVIDYVGAMVRRYMDANNIAEERMRHHIGGTPLMAKSNIADAFNCPVWLLHQYSGAANSRSPATLLHHTDASEAKNFAENLDACFCVGVPDPVLNVARFGCTKHRRQPPMQSTFIKIEGALNRVVGVGGRYTLDPSSRSIVLVTEAGRLPGGTAPRPALPSPSSSESADNPGDTNPAAAALAAQ